MQTNEEKVWISFHFNAHWKINPAHYLSSKSTLILDLPWQKERGKKFKKKGETHKKNDDCENTDGNKKDHLITVTTILELPVGVHP